MTTAKHAPHKSKTFVIILKIDNSFDKNEIQSWIDHYCVGTVNVAVAKHSATYKFRNADDAFKFKLHWERA